MRARLLGVSWIAVVVVAVVAGCAAEKGGEPNASAPAAAPPPPPPVAATNAMPGAPPPATEVSDGAGIGGPPKGTNVMDSDPCAGGKIVEDSGGTTGGVGAVTGDLDKGAVRDAVHKQGPALAACRTAAISRGLARDQRVEVHFTIGKTGDVTDARATAADGQLADCIAQVFRALRFTPSGSTATVVYPLVVKP
jgi:hypothetical protein